MIYLRSLAAILVLPVCLAALGCSGEPKLPDLTEVEGTVLLGGKPLPHARVTFNPTRGGLPANSIGIAVTDEHGKFQLTTAGKTGAVAGEHVVTVVEGPPPENVRGEDAQEKMAAYKASLINRPIPAKYGNVNQSDAKVTVTTDTKDYRIDLSR
jgi:hypothetical protein